MTTSFSFARFKKAIFAICLVVFSWALAAGAASALAGCKQADPVQDPGAYQRQQEVKAEATYEGELMACTAKSKTLAESERCEDLVDVKWGVATPKDGGK